MWRPASHSSNFALQSFNSPPFNIFPRRSNAIQKVIDTQYTFMLFSRVFANRNLPRFTSLAPAALRPRHIPPRYEKTTTATPLVPANYKCPPGANPFLAHPYKCPGGMGVSALIPKVLLELLRKIVGHHLPIATFFALSFHAFAHSFIFRSL